MKTIILSQGKETVIDDGDFELVSKYKWFAHTQNKIKFYAYAHIPKSKKLMSLSRLIMGEPQGLIVDHKNGDSLDNRRENLRICNHHQNAQNRQNLYRPDKTTEYKGVTFYEKPINAVTPFYLSHITYKGKMINLGHFSCKRDAAIAYNVAARLFFKSFAWYNHIEPCSCPDHRINFPTKPEEE